MSQGNCVDPYPASISVTVYPAPITSVSSATVCAGTSATIGVTGGAATTYVWNTSATTSSITVTPSATTTYNVTGTYTFDTYYSCTSTVTSTVTVNQPPPICLPHTVEVICPGSCVTVNASCGRFRPPNVNYTWAPSAGLSATIGGTVTACPSSNTVYTVTATNTITGCSATDIDAINVYSPIVISLSSTAACRHCNGTALANASGGTGPYSYSWMPGGYNTSSISGLCPGVYTVTVTDIHGCKSSASVTIVSGTPPIVHAASTTICSGASANICATGTATTYIWNGTTVAPCITLAPTVTTTYSLTGSNGSCSTSTTFTVTVDKTPIICNLPETILICPGNCATLDAACRYRQAGVTYAWTPNVNLTPATGTGPVVTACPTVTTIYTVTATNTLTPLGCSTTSTAEVEIFPSSFTISGPRGLVCETTNNYSVSPLLPPPVVYSWTSTNPTSSGSGPSASIGFASPGGTITWTVTDPSGCSSNVTETVACKNPINPNGPEKGNTDGKINEIAIVYPNPAGDILNVQMELQPNEQISLCMYNSIGEVMKCETLNTNFSTISTSMLPAGIYFYRITYTDGTLIKADKVIILH